MFLPFLWNEKTTVFYFICFNLYFHFLNKIDFLMGNFIFSSEDDETAISDDENSTDDFVATTTHKSMLNSIIC